MDTDITSVWEVLVWSFWIFIPWFGALSYLIVRREALT